jgi:hypothetical protein
MSSSVTAEWHAALCRRKLLPRRLSERTAEWI